MSLIYVSDADPGYTRHKAGKGFVYKTFDGRKVTDSSELARIQALGIPPAYENVWICIDPHGHIQATGRDARGRKQYRYHADWTANQDATKYAHLVDFAHKLPRIRRRVKADMNQSGLNQTKVIAIAIYLLETTLIRIGNEGYAKANKSYGLTTLRAKHVTIKREELRFQFTGKSGKEWNLKVNDRRIAKVIKACQELPGQRLFQYIGEDGERHALSSQDVNDYLRELAGEDISAKDFRTWAGTVQAMAELTKLEPPASPTAAKRELSAVVKRVAAKLGNTPAICRKCYIHPSVFEAFEKGRITINKVSSLAGLTKQERLTVALLEASTGVQPLTKPIALAKAA